jgi:hypothetical protein
MGGGPRYDPSKPAGAAQQAPLKEESRRIHEESMADQAAGGAGLYVQSTKCIPMGMPFQMSIVPFPLEFVVTAKTTFVLFEVMTSEPRRIYTDGRDFPKNQPPTYPGYSIGRWLDTDGGGKFLQHAHPALCPARALPVRIPLGPRPSLHRLRRSWLFHGWLRSGARCFVRRLPRYYAGARLPVSVHHRLRLLVFPMRTVPLTQH